MYELVNTSLPNGLIAGTHGFATVAMTKGVSDILRGRLEALCAYTHRTSVHDATYYQQNPVNWFHVTLPQGEHVVGRVAPSDFDYTGRTNRLARIRVFAANEMPAVGGAEILAKEKHWFSQPWQGDPRYLEEDRNTCGHLRMLNPSQLSSAPAWDALFGSSGSRYAQQVAWQVEKNLSAGGKTIYFKTSTAWDVSGEKLLGLFVDVINLLPVEMRPRVTFSTYPVSLPGGTGCNLRGVYDRDKFFDASSATQAWVDCENARLVHAELLPTTGSVRNEEIKTDASQHAADARTGNRFRSGSSAPKFGIRRAPTVGGDPYSYRNMFAPKQKGTDMFIVGIVVAGLVVLLAAGGLFYWMTQDNKRQMEDSGAAEAVERERQNLVEAEEHERAERERIAKEREAASEREAHAKADSVRKEREDEANRKDYESKRDEDRQKAREKIAQEEKDRAEKARMDGIARERRRLNVAFLDAEKFSIGAPSYSYNSPKGRPDEPFWESDGCRVYYYVGNVLTNEPAGFWFNQNSPARGYLKWGAGLKSKQSEVPRTKCGFVLWYDPASKRVYIDRRRDSSGPERWFAQSHRIDLAQEYFGGDEALVKLWEKRQGGKTRYVIEYSLPDQKHGPITKSFTTERSVWTALEMVEETQNDVLVGPNKKVADAKSKMESLEGQFTQCTNSIHRLQAQTNTVSELVVAYHNDEAKAKELNRSNKEEELAKCRKEMTAILHEGVFPPKYPEKKQDPKYKAIGDAEKHLNQLSSKLKSEQEKKAKLGKHLDDAKKAFKDAKDDLQRQIEKYKNEVICTMAFILSVEGEKNKE